MASGERRSATNSFQTGLAHGTCGKLARIRQEREAASAGTGPDLVPVKAAVVADEIDKLGLSFKRTGRASRKLVVTAAYEEGREAGGRFDYRPGIAVASENRGRR